MRHTAIILITWDILEVHYSIRALLSVFVSYGSLGDTKTQPLFYLNAEHLKSKEFIASTSSFTRGKHQFLLAQFQESCHLVETLFI